MRKDRYHRCSSCKVRLVICMRRVFCVMESSFHLTIEATVTLALPSAVNGSIWVCSIRLWHNVHTNCNVNPCGYYHRWS
jgi:hypothetical protein